VDKNAGTWAIRIVNGARAGKNAEPPSPTYSGGKGISLFTGLQISDDYITATITLKPKPAPAKCAARFMPWL
jgi:hypothetical protein